MNPGLPQQDPTWNPQPPTYPAGYGPPPQQTPPPRGRWIIAVVVAVTALITATATAITTIEVRGGTSSSSTASPPVTITITAPTHTPQTPVPLPTAQADRQTCQDGFIASNRLMDKANAALDELPTGMRIDNPAVKTNPDWLSAVQRAGNLEDQAADILDVNIAPGTTPILAAAANTSVFAIRGLSFSVTNIDPNSGNVADISNAAAAEMRALCRRLAPL